MQLSIADIVCPGEMKEKQSSRVAMHDVELGAFGLLIEYLYTGKISIDEDNVLSLLSTANLLQISAVLEACCDFLIRQLNFNNCLGIHSFADTYSCEKLQIASHKFALKHFKKVSLTNEFVSLPYAEVLELISSDHLNAAEEETVYAAVIRWVKHNIEQRAVDFASLLSHVRLPLMSRTFLNTCVVDEELICTRSDAKDLLIEAMRYHLFPNERAKMTSTRTKPRVPEGLEPCVFVIEGYPSHTCEFYNPREESWIYIASTIQPRLSAGIVTSYNRHIYAIGGK